MNAVFYGDVAQAAGSISIDMRAGFESCLKRHSSNILGEAVVTSEKEHKLDLPFRVTEHIIDTVQVALALSMPKTGEQ